MPPKVLVLGEKSYHQFFIDKGWKVSPTLPPHKDAINRFDLVCFTGGTDISPLLYDESPHKKTQFHDSARDVLEVHIFNIAVMNKIPMVGICRGAQLLTALNGGKLIQHVKNHNGYHNIVTDEGMINVSSSHHQMMYPWDIDHILLGYSKELSNTYEGRSKEIGNHYYQHSQYFPTEAYDEKGYVKEPEVVYYPQTNALAHQAHPEWMTETSPYYQYFFKTIEQYLGVK
ncbi:MAG: gamma-glutamyl-gamma-aminobutyrate hydrolase family protein [Saprospiraceae bacterium]|nr:gamma-glutamyl-gamma-aminobutyrate hydrolase family protein [Saprospiraceae bacterium]